MNIPELIQQQHTFFLSNATKGIDFRIEQLKLLHTIIKENEDLLKEAIFADFKKSDFDTYTNELGLLYADISEAIQSLRKWTKKKKVRTNLLNLPARSYIQPEPLGVALIIGAWNYPYQLSLAPAIAAMAAGCTIILKPSELPLNTSHAMASIIGKAFDKQFFAVVEGGVDETTELLKHRFDKIFFTGSTSVAKIVYQAAAKYLTPVTLELGGKSPAIVTESCNLAMSVKRLVWGKFLNAGQTCIAPDYVLVHQSIEKQFIAAVKQEIDKAQFSLENGNYVQIINKENTQRLIDLIATSKLCHGGGYDLDNRYIEPTVLCGVTAEDACMTEEIFGPILPICTYDQLDSAVAFIKEYPKPLSCYVFTEQKRVKEQLLREVSFGGGAINDTIMHITNSRLPFGGVGDSGMGNYHGEAGFKAFSHYKSILDKSTWFEASIKYYPRKNWKMKLIRWIFG